MDEVLNLAKKAKEASKKLAQLSTEQKNRALLKIAQYLEENMEKILTENQKDLAEAKKGGLSPAFIERLTLNEKRILDMAEGVRQVAKLPDPVGEVLGMTRRPNGLVIGQVRVPLGVVGIIYESRPNVTVDAAALCLKAGNAVILRGGKEAFNSNLALVTLMEEALRSEKIPEGAVGMIKTTSRDAANYLMRLNGYLDVLIPRGGAGLIKTVVENSTVPVIETGVGNCHVYVEEDADLEMAERIIINAKCQRPAVCNAMETLLVHEKIAPVFLPQIGKALKENGVEIRGCEVTRRYIPDALPATEEDYYTEFLDLILAVRVVRDLDEAIAHITKYGSGHSEAIVTRDYFKAKRFTEEVDAAAVYVNASTRFTDGFEFGFGAEIGISTQKLHARGPMGLKELTTTKYVIYGTGQIRG
ncbi:glutamate-5-semialdehyde dehydrogenase [Carboxydothermus ferrireducens]|uniref:Gamma-glutamyl phosphate reductase n=1 Tax=Carboxydothermus ferrireducens DSM 11255 TaxID=1119529 RepID=A0ABX2R7S7_9THEO|nr:glutamate-5-semialdehyde dehydrogenase [Carboxydothermus ferrireducens]NYE57231.1 glutamate-5-semialdehyde dehydrogenase [Carboxydothermus ferrireducens DSM 11255]